MARIKLIVTGDLEKLALHKSLKQVFPAHREDGDEVEWDTPRMVHGATSHRLHPDKVPSQPMLGLAQAMLDEVGPGKRRHGKPADLVVVIDDVELGNLDQEAVIATHFRKAVHQKLNALDRGTQLKYQERLRNKASFHLLKPMAEAYLFGDSQALRDAGVQQDVRPLLLSSDVEAFETNDPAWLPECHRENKRLANKLPWWRHERHPKHYLEHLVARGGDFYEETDHGKRALLNLRWETVSKEEHQTPILCSLFEDLADWYGVPTPLKRGRSHPDFYPPRTARRETLLLRNL